MYKPNWQNQRVRTRAIKALTYVEQYTRSNRVDWLSVKEIYRHLGNTSRPLGLYLKTQLLEPVDPYYNPLTGQCKKYRLNLKGYEEIRQELGITAASAHVSPEITEQLTSGEFEYQLKKDRWYTAAQYIPRRIRGQVLSNHGLRYHYDIEACAPTVLLQQAQRENSRLECTTLTDYILNRSQRRKELAQSCGISEHTVKVVVNSILQGGILSRWQQNKTFMAINCDHHAVIMMNNNPYFGQLKQDISRMWRVLKPLAQRDHLSESPKRLTSRDKASLYRSYENLIGLQIRKILNKQKIKYLWLHDGWACDGVIDPEVIETQVRIMTGFRIRLDWGIYE